ncbi:Tetraacyldisaccharide 4'-kinase [hydrothermal vent metagenome]|uniref:tetraacyldisaccharide 4'-kinase n=1 Tax=hydrothermal vent metagenome TaxID=652676 RepID=A0A3B1AMT3_9ZZZZ
MKQLEEYWSDRNPVSLSLLPLSWLFCLIAWLRRRAFHFGLFKIHQVQAPVIVVGNISVGGTGKTPLVVWLAGYLQQQGFRPGIVARGYGADTGNTPRPVRPDSKVDEVGDEPLLISRRTGCPMFVAPDRVAAARALLAATDCDIIISDDGMQHYALGRDIEIAVIDGRRRFGNSFCLPAGPLREHPSRLKQVDLVIANGQAEMDEHVMHIRASKAVNLVNPEIRCDLEEFSGQRLLALAGIGDPQRFFSMLREHGLHPNEWAFPDHHSFVASDISPDDDFSVLMTEKDAVKCSHIARPRHWYVPIDVEVDEAFSQRLAELLRGLKRG